MGKIARFWVPVFAIVTTSAPAGAQSNIVRSQLSFGKAVDVFGGRIVVGEPYNQRVPGMAYVFEQNADGVWDLVTPIEAGDGYLGNNFGSSLAGADDHIFVGATGSDKAGGAVYVFVRSDGGVWQETAVIRPADSRAADSFGSAVASAGDLLAVSNRPLDGPPSVYVFARNAETGVWAQEAVINPTGEGNHSGFGSDVVADEATLFVGSPRDGAGVVHVYAKEDDGGWAEAAVLRGNSGAQDASGNTASESFGARLLLAGSQLFVTAPNAERFTGRVYSFIRSEAGGFTRGPNFTPFDAGNAHGFARDVALAGNDLVVSALSPNGMAGAVYYMEMSGDGRDVVRSEKHYDPQALPLTFYGETLDAEADIVAVAAHTDVFQAGSVYVYNRAQDPALRSAGQKLMAPKALGYSSIVGERVKCEDGLAGGFGCERVDLVSFIASDDLGIPRGILTNDLWGWTDGETGKEYAIVGRNDGTSFVDVSDPVNPVNVGFLPRTAGSPPTIWRDMKVYKDHAFIVADGAGPHGVQIFDLRQLRDVANQPAEFEETARYDGIFSAHNIVINEETGFAYTVGNSQGGETCAGGSHIINVQDPVNPLFAGCFAHTTTGNAGTGYTHDAQCVTYKGPDERYTGREICFAANENAISIADVTDKQNTQALARGDYPNPGYAHQGWLSEDHRHFFVNDELDEINGTTDGTRTLIWDVAELDDPVLVNEYVSANKASDHNLYIRGQYMYQSNYVSGIRIVDVSNVEAPVEVGHFDTVPWGTDKPGFGGSWSNFPFFKSGVIIATSSEEGLFILKRSEVDS